MKTIPRFFKPPESSYFLFGPRGTGKSTFLRHHYTGAEWIDLLDPEKFRIYSARPERIIELVRKTKNHIKTFIIDEIQLVPELLSAVHLLIEEDKECKFILTGSSARKLKRTGIDLLAGRAIIKTMHSFMMSELKNQYTLETALDLGMVPLIAAADDPREKLRSYIAIYLQEEVKQEGLVRNLGDFSRFLEIVSFSHGAEINASNIARECSVGRKAVESYLAILQDLLIGYTLPVFSKKAERSSRSHPKFYFFDTGIFRSVRPSGPLDRPEEIHGVALEGLVAQHLKAYLSYTNNDTQLFYWRTYGGAEVDFVLYGTEIFAAFEVKNASRIRPGDFRGLRSFISRYPEATHRVVLYRGSEHMLIDDIHCIPVEHFLKRLHPLKTLREII